ncbi:TIM barrel protein [Candidatus Poribacteria bacterium]|nr:TIM barrel protein [Candidatus Poribacteria bacterium]
MRIGIHTGSRVVDQIANECRELGVSEVFLSAGAIPEINCDKVKKFKDELIAREITLSGMIIPVPSKDAVLGNNEAEVERLCEMLRAIGEAGVGTVLFYPLDSFLLFKEDSPSKPILDVTIGSEEWARIIEFFRRVASVADEVKLKIANHVWAVDLLREIWNTVGSPNLGVAYCQGMYIIGENPHTAVERLGVERIFFCHARNLVRHGVGFPGHEEVPLDEGDVDIAQCVKALAQAGYDGLIIPEHLGNGNMAEAVIYLKSLLAA